jgi:hypothetical protein
MSVAAAPTTSAASIPAPGSVVWSSRLYLIASALGLVGIVVSLVLLPGAIDRSIAAFATEAQRQRVADFDAESLGRASAIGGTVLGAVIAVVLSVLTFLFARKLRRGRNWARTVLLVFAVLQIAGVISAAGVGALQFVVVAVAAVLSFLPASTAWFRAVKPQPKVRA